MASTHERLERGRHFYGPGPYIEREVDTGLLEALRAGEFALVLAARGSGKTSLRIRTTQRLAEQGVRVATVDLGAIGAETRADAFCASVVIEAGRSLGLESEAKIAWRRSKGPPQMRLRACVREVLLEPSPEPLVLFIDELELVRALGPARDDFFAALRAMSDARGHDPVWRRLSVCLIGAMTRDELVSDPGRSSFDLPAREFGPRDFNREQIDAFAETLAPLGVETKELLDALYDWTSGSPALLQWLCGDMLLRELARGHEAEVVEAVVRETFLQRGPEVDPLLGDTARRLHRDRRDPYRTRILAAYERVLRGETIDLRGRQLGSEGALIVARLKVAGLVAASAGAKLRVRNRVVERAFDRNWVRRALAGRPVSDALERWESGGRRVGALLRGEALEAAIAWVEGRPDVTPSERDFVLASERAYSRRFRRLSWFGSALSLGLASALGLLYWGEELGLIEAPAPVVERASPPTDASPAPVESTPDPPTQEPAFVTSARQAVEQAAGGDELARISTLETELAAIELRLAIERAARAELLAPMSTRRAEGLELALGSMSAWREAGSSVDDVPAPVTRGLTANLASPGDTTLFAAHAGPVFAIVFNADGARFATVGAGGGGGDGGVGGGGEIRIWERDTGRRVAGLTNIAGAVELLALSPSGRRVAALSKDGALTVWGLDDGSALGPAPLGVPPNVPMPLAPIDSLLVDDGGHVSVIRRDGSLDTVDPKFLSSSARLRPSALPRTLSVDDAIVIDGGFMAQARVGVISGESLELWDVASGQAQASIRLPKLAEAKLRALLATQEAEALLVQFEGSAELTIWEPAHGTVRSLAVAAGASSPEDAVAEASALTLALSPEGELLATGGADQIGRVWSIETGQLLTEVEAHDDPLTSLAFTPDGAALVIGDRSGQLRIHPLSFGQASLPLRGATLGAFGVAATVHYSDSSLELRWSGGQTSARWPLQRPLAEAAVSVDGSRLALLYADGELVLVSGAAGPEGEALARVEGRSLDMALSADGSLLAVASEDRRVSLLGANGQPIATLSGHEAPVDRLALSPDGARLVSADRSKFVRVWDPGTAALLGAFACERRAEHLAIAGDLVLIVDQRGGAELWSTQARARLASFELGAEPITSLALSADGEWIALGRGDAVTASVELWRPSSIEALARFRAVGPIDAVRFADDGETLLAVEGQGRLARWPARPQAWLAEACASLAPGSVVPGVCVEAEDGDGEAN